MAESSKLDAQQFEKRSHAHTIKRVSAPGAQPRSPRSIAERMQEGHGSFEKPTLDVGNNGGVIFDKRMHYYQNSF